MGNKILVVILATFAMISTAFADHHEGGDKEKKPFSIYGDFAGSVQFLGNDDGAAGSNPSDHDDFDVDLVEVNVEKNWSHSKLHLSIGYGDTAAAYNATGTNGNLLNVMNAYYAMESSYGLNFQFGKFESGLALGSFNHMDNTLYSRSYAFNLTPNFFTGINVGYTVSPMIDLGFVVANGAQPGPNPNPDDNANKTMAVFAGINPMDALAINLRYVTGVEGVPGTNDVNRTMIIANAAYMVNDMINVALDYTSVSTETRAATSVKQDASSIAAYVDANFGMFGAALRYEMLADDKAGLVFANNPPTTSATEDNTVNAITLGVHTEIDQNARLILEYRTESADEKVWNDKDGAPTDSRDVTTLGLMYRF